MLNEDAFVDFACPYCGATLSFPADDRGRLVPCAECTEPVIVPIEGQTVGGKVPIPLQTQRLVLRRLKPTDWKDLLALVSSEALFAHVDGGPMTEEQVVEWAETDGQSKLTTPGQPFYLGIELQQTAQLIGCVSLMFSPPNPLSSGFPAPTRRMVIEPPDFFDLRAAQAQLSLLVHPAHQRKGIGTEAATAVLELCFGILGIHRAVAACTPDNIPATRLCAKLGMRPEAHHHKAVVVRGEWRDMLIFAMLRDEFLSRHA
ncbi:MAG: GNAT family N-acetyltransferase [Verrucomicrobiae bacterium]|nr:GNAT family N-acetyltransferase [Verrucomicrobiae bacterium]MDW7980017.1 GNAT family protein [Verrucomicrobiales bacterium]